MKLISLEDYILSLRCNPVAFQKYVTAYTKLNSLNLHLDMFVGENPLFKGFEIAIEHSTRQTTIVKKENFAMCWSNNSCTFEHGYYTISDMNCYGFEINESVAHALSPVDETEYVFLTEIKEFDLPTDCKDKLALFTQYSVNYLDPETPKDVFEYEYLMNSDGDIRIENTWIPIKTGNFKSKQQIEDYIKDGRVRKIQH